MGVVLNGIIVLQFILFWGNTGKVAAAPAKKDSGKKTKKE
jgi:hypothetical protein